MGLSPHTETLTLIVPVSSPVATNLSPVTTKLLMDALVVKEEQAKAMNTVQKVYINMDNKITWWQDLPGW